MINIKTIDFQKGNGLVPVIIQDEETKTVLMLGYMDALALEKTIETGLVTFWSRSKERLWTKGEESGNTLKLCSIKSDCDNDSLLITVVPTGPTCHTGSDTCWADTNAYNALSLEKLERIILDRKNTHTDESYTSSLFSRGINKVAQKVGEEAIELVIEAKDDNKDLFLNEAADLMYHYLILLVAKGYKLSDVIQVLKSREKQ